ncbi:hypothetical protein JKF63_04893 [Porcisia hertigi]|uniref:Uncharacterized protein n=1 Tax=Porcisia hertigi TaxID=2761500 RepID=A0A836L9W2_9TRYP|nr:hypothetical protein JKF63_04893 [Porcisia hertigi]
MFASTIPGELASIQRSIQSALSKIEKNSAKRGSQEQNLISTVAGAKSLNRFFSAHPTTNDEVVRALRSAGEEEQVEIECIQRYQRFVEARSTCFTFLEVKMSTLLKEVSRALVTSGKMEEFTSDDLLPEVEENQSDSEAQRLLRLWRTVLHIHDLVLGPLIRGHLGGPRNELQCIRAEEERYFARESVLRNTITDVQKMVAAIQKRLGDLNTEAEAVHTIAECTASMRFQDKATRPIVAEKDEHFGSHMRKALYDLQRSTERLRKERVAVDLRTATLAEKSRNLRLQTVACKLSTEAILQTTGEVTDGVNSLTNAQANALRELNQKTQECTSKQGRLENALEKHERLSALLMEQSENEKFKAERIVAAGQAYHFLMTKGGSQREKLTSLRRSIARIESEIRGALADRQRIVGEVQYLSRLFSNPSVAQRVLVQATERCNVEPKPIAVDNYIRFIQKARIERRTFH